MNAVRHPNPIPSHRTQPVTLNAVRHPELVSGSVSSSHHKLNPSPRTHPATATPFRHPEPTPSPRTQSVTLNLFQGLYPVLIINLIHHPEHTQSPHPQPVTPSLSVTLNLFQGLYNLSPFISAFLDGTFMDVVLIALPFIP